MSKRKKEPAPRVKIPDRRWRYNLMTPEGLSAFIDRTSIEGQCRDRLLNVVDTIRVNRRRPHAREHLKELRSIARLVREYIRMKAWSDADRELLRANTVVLQMRLAYALPLARRGRTFTTGRKLNTGGPIRKAIARLLKNNPALKKPSDIWELLAKDPPRGWTFYGNNARLGKYIEGPKGGDNMQYGRFSNICKEERDKLLV